MHLARFLILLACMGLLQSCANIPATESLDQTRMQDLYEKHLMDISAIDSFRMQARIGVQTAGKGFSGSMRWQHNVSTDDIGLFSPLGSQVASMQKNVDQVTLTDANGKILIAADAETLTRDLLGWSLPLNGLTDWSLGRPNQSPIQGSSLNTDGLLTRLQQEGWVISYQNYTEQNGHLLPTKILLNRDKLNLKILIDRLDMKVTQE